MRLAQFGFAPVFSVAALVTGIVVIAVRSLAARPYLTLDPDAITVQRLMTRISVGWGQLAPGGLPPATKRDLPFPPTYPATASSPTADFMKRRPLPVRELQLDPAFLAHTIRTYVDLPERRSAISTGSELAGLQFGFTPDSASPTG
jgi:hypothetical protein